MIGLSRIERAISDVPKGGMQTGDPKVTLKLCDAQRIKAELEHLTALSTQVDSLLDDRKAFVKKEFQLLKEIERLEIELKKRDEQSAALAAQVGILKRHLIKCAELVNFDAGTAIDWLIDNHHNLLKQANKDPEQHLRELRAEVVGSINLDAYNAGSLHDFGGGNVSWWQDYIRSELGAAHDFYQSQIDQYADNIGQGK